MPTLPDVFIMPKVPDADLQEILTETEEENEFDVKKKRNRDGTWRLTFTRKSSSATADGEV